MRVNNTYNFREPLTSSCLILMKNSLKDTLYDHDAANITVRTMRVDVSRRGDHPRFEDETSKVTDNYRVVMSLVLSANDTCLRDCQTARFPNTFVHLTETVPAEERTSSGRFQFDSIFSRYQNEYVHPREYQTHVHVYSAYIRNDRSLNSRIRGDEMSRFPVTIGYDARISLAKTQIERTCHYT